LINDFECRIHMCISFDLFTCVTIGDKGVMFLMIREV
jgi:hypothetical protein